MEEGLNSRRGGGGGGGVCISIQPNGIQVLIKSDKQESE